MQLVNTRRALAALVVFAAACGTTSPPAERWAPGPGVPGATRHAGPQPPSGGPAAAEPGVWTPFEEFWFDPLRADLRRADSGKVTEIADYLRRNPGQQVGLDGAREPRNLELTQRRVASVRNALLKAGVPLYKIQSGYFSSSQPRRDSRVEVLISSR